MKILRLTIADAFASLNSGLAGLSDAEAQRRLVKKPWGKPRGIWNMISQIDEKPKQASGYQTQWE